MKRGFSPLMLSGVVVLFSLSAAKAATDTWVGSPTLNWSSTANWFSGLLPLSGDSLVFGPTSYGTTLTDNLMTPGTFNLGGITFNSGAPAYTINPGILGTNGFTLTGGIVNNSVSTQTINDAISLSGTQTFTTSAGGGNLTLGGFVSGTGSVTVAGGGLLTLASSLGNSFSGPTIVSGGTLRAISSNSNTLNAALDLNFGNGVVLNSGTMAVAITVGETAGNVAPLYSATGGPNGMGMMYLNGANYLNIQPKSGNLTNLSSSASYTIGMWIETSTPGASLLYKGVIGNWGTNDQIFYLGAAASGAATLVGPDGAGGHVAGVQYAGGWVGSNTNVNTGRWEYVTYVRSGGTTTTYVNGVATGTSTGMSGPEQGTQDIRIGYNDTDTGDGAQMFLGSVSDIQVYGSALTSTQVKSLYNGGALGSLSGSSQVQLPNSGAGLEHQWDHREHPRTQRRWRKPRVPRRRGPGRRRGQQQPDFFRRDLGYGRRQQRRGRIADESRHRHAHAQRFGGQHLQRPDQRQRRHTASRFHEPSHTRQPDQRQFGPGPRRRHASHQRPALRHVVPGLRRDRRHRPRR